MWGEFQVGRFKFQGGMPDARCQMPELKAGCPHPALVGSFNLKKAVETADGTDDADDQEFG
jgi:hypothetical protein